jgi:hypothetical protein
MEPAIERTAPWASRAGSVPPQLDGHGRVGGQGPEHDPFRPVSGVPVAAHAPALPYPLGF